MNGATSELAWTQTWILAGGEGQRLHPLTASRPKPIVSFGGRFRIIDFTLSNCLNSGLSRVSLVTQHLYEEFHQYVRLAWNQRWNQTGQADRSPLVLLPPTSGKRYRGNADAIFHNIELLESDNAGFVLILSGDHIYHMDYSGFLRQHAETDADLTIAAVEHRLGDASRFGVIEVERNFRITGFEEKPVNPQPLSSRPSMALVSMGIYVFKKKVLLELLRRFCEAGHGYDFGRNIIPPLVRSGRTYAYDFRDEARNSPCYWRDIGTLDSYYAASMDVADPDGPFDPAPDADASRIEDAPPVRSGSYVRRSVISPSVQINEGAIVNESVLMPGVVVGKGAHLHRTIVEEGVHIPAGFTAGFDLDQDRQHHTVSDNGVVIVSRIPVNERLPVVHFAVRTTSARATTSSGVNVA